jgi:hypothetical protein
MTRRRAVPYLFAILAALVAVGAYAANKSATLVPPANYTAGGWKISIEPRAAGPGETATSWCAYTSACAHDAIVGATDCFHHQACTDTPPSEITAFINARLSAARSANGY